MSATPPASGTATRPLPPSGGEGVQRAVDAGDGEALAGVGRILERGNAADRIREVAQRCGSMPELVDWLAKEVNGGGTAQRAG